MNTKTDLSPDLQLLITCCQVNLSKKDIQYLRGSIEISKSNADFWRDLSTLAHQHGIFPLLYQTLKRYANALMPPEVLAAFKAQNMAIVQKNMLMSAELIRIIKLFKENTIEALPFKGPTLAQMAYEDITLRQYSDLDILIKQESRHQISELLESQGYKQMFSHTPDQEKHWYKQAKDMILFHSKKGIYLELHWLLLDNDYPMQVDLDAIWTHPKTIVIHGHRIQTFSTESLLLYLCIHGSKHLWERLEWIKDIDLMIRTRKIEWSYLATEINKSGFERMFLLGLYLSSSLFQTPLPRQFKAQLTHQKWLIRLNDFILSDWRQHHNMFHRSFVMLYLFPEIKMKMLYLKKVIFKPSQSEYSFVSLPEGYYWGYYFVRPYLLIKKYLTKD